MRITKTSRLGFFLLWIAATPMLGDTVDEVVQKHLAAKGGAQRWSEVETLRMTGSYTCFSKVYPFELTRARENRYLLDTTMNGHSTVIGYDGATAWWNNGFLMEGSDFIKGPDLAKQTREFDFATPFFDLEARGYEAELLGEVDFEGETAIGIELDRGDGSAETWYLDPVTYLEIGRVSPGSDFGRPMPQRTVFDDHRTVDGLVIPFYSETQWYTRDHIVEADEVVINAEVDDSLFTMPPPLGMADLQAMAGDWEVAVETFSRPGAEPQQSSWTSSIAARVRGGLLEESFTSARGTGVLRTLSYDRHRKLYKLTEIDDSQTQLDIQEGDLDESGALVLSNLETGTAGEMFGTTTHVRTTIKDVSGAGFRVEQEVSRDGGESWMLQRASSYSKPGTASVED